DLALQYSEQASIAECQTAFDGPGAAVLFRQHAYQGNRELAIKLLREKHSQLPRLGLPNTVGSWGLLLLVVEGLFVLGERDEAALLYPSALEATHTGARMIHGVARFPQTAAGISAAAAGLWDRAEEHFRAASLQAEEFPHPLELAEVHRFHGQMLIERNGAGD